MRKPMAKLWMSALDGGEVMYSDDLPSCCQREARGADDPFESDSFECVSCGAMWRAAEEPMTAGEECAFMAADEREDHRGAA